MNDFDKSNKVLLVIAQKRDEANAAAIKKACEYGGALGASDAWTREVGNDSMRSLESNPYTNEVSRCEDSAKLAKQAAKDWNEIHDFLCSRILKEYTPF